MAVDFADVNLGYTPKHISQLRLAWSGSLGRVQLDQPVDKTAGIEFFDQ